MAVGREMSVMELDGARLTAVSAVVSGNSVEVTRWLSATRPDSVAADSADAVGEWIAAEFKQAGLSRSRVVLAVSRGDVVLKQLTLPAGADTGEADIAGAVRLQMVRQLTMSLEGTAIDYAPVGGAQGGSVSVLAGAMPADRVNWSRAVAKAAGMNLRRIGLRCAGAAALMAELSQRRAAPILGVAVGAGTTEFVIVEDGQMMLARAVDVPKPASRADFDMYAERLSVEAKRTWMSYRSSRPGMDAEAVAVVGDGELARRVGDQCAGALGVPCKTVGLPGLVQMTAQISENERAAAMPLVGLLVEGVLGRPGLDFANPRKLPDRAAAVRQRVLAAALVAIAVGGVGYVGANKKLGHMQEELKVLQAKESDLRKQADQYYVLHAKINHIEQWEQAKVDWLGHIRELSDQLPDPHDAVVGELTGRMMGGAVYDPKGKSYPGGEWTAREQAVFEVSGSVENRQVVTDLRERLLGGGVYRVESRGPDTPDKFSLELLTADATPQAAIISDKPIAKSSTPPKQAGKKPEAATTAPKPAPTPVTQASDAAAPGGGK
jgi:Tfp pilus assembly PilM family ATPase